MKQLSQAELKFYHDLIHTPDGIPVSRAGKNWKLDLFLQSEAIVYHRRGAGGVYKADPQLVRSVLKVNYEIADLDQTVALINSSTSKGEIALVAGHTKALGEKPEVRHIGLRAGSSAPITLSYERGTIEVSNLPSVLLQLPEVICETQNFTAQPELSAVICENKEDYLTLTPDILELLQKELNAPSLLLWRNDGIERIIRLLEKLGISKIYHYGDFDLCGVQIFETTTLKYAPYARMITCEKSLDEMIIQSGSRSLFNKQLSRMREFQPVSKDGQIITKIIRTHRKVIEQQKVNALLARMHS